MTHKIGGLEGGGTKFVCAVGDGTSIIFDEIRFPTTCPEETYTQAVTFFRRHNLEAIGIAHFGPLVLDPASPSYGTILATPKEGWSGVNILARFRSEFHLPFVIESDVNAAAFGEHVLVARNKDLESLVYYTIGTGIGAGLIVNGKVVHGLTHPEAGHMRVPHNWALDPFPGICPFHGDCLEGLASGPALAHRWGQPAEHLPPGHSAWDLEAEYLSSALVNTITLLSPQRIILGGGVMESAFMFDLIRSKVNRLLNDYIVSPILNGSLDEYIISPGLGKRSGILGAMALARTLLEGEE